MGSQDVPMIIAASVSGLLLIGTVITKIIGFRSTSADIKRQIQATQQNTAGMLEQQRVENERTREQQRAQPNTTLQAQSERLYAQLEAQSEQPKQMLEEQPPDASRGLQGQSLTPRLPMSTGETL